MKRTPLISIILPLYNGEEFLAQALDSCLSQTIQNWELIIVNDCSTDKSLNIASTYQKTDSRITIIENDINKKLPYTLNAGFAIARGEYVTWTSDDNILKNNYLEVLLDSIIKTESDFVYSNYDVVNQNNLFIKRQPVGSIKELLFQNVIGPSFLGKARLFKDNPYDVGLFRVEDYEFWISNLIGLKCNRIEESLYRYRLHGASLTSKISTSGGFKQELIDKMFSKLQHKFNYSAVTKHFLVLNHLTKREASRYFLENNMIILNDMIKIDQKYNQHSLVTAFKAHIKHYEKLMDFMVVSRSLRTSYNIVQKYRLSIPSILWLCIYTLKRIKRKIIKPE